MSDLLERVEESIRQRGLLRRGQSALVAVSGGVDSMVLLHLLHILSQKQSWRLAVANLDHQLRGRSSAADQRLVVRAARKLGLQVVTDRTDVNHLARMLKWSLEMAARKARHEFLARAARRLNIRTVALAHHADDQLELFFLRLFRGSGSNGLAGMKWRNPSPADARVELVRPFLDLPKAALIDFARRHRIHFREDASNASRDIQRNRIRNELLPLLRREFQPALDRTVSRAIEIVGAEAEFTTSAAERWLEGTAGSGSAGKGRSRNRQKADTPFAELPVAVQRRCIQIQLVRWKLAPDFGLVETLRLHPNNCVKVSSEFTVMLEAGGFLRVQSQPMPSSPDPADRCVNFEADGRTAVFGGVKFSWRRTTRKPPLPLRAKAGFELFDADKVGTVILLRHWQPGDRFQPSGMERAVKLQDLFVNGKIPRTERGCLVVAQTAEGKLFWVERLRIAEPFKVSASTKRCLQWRWKRL